MKTVVTLNTSGYDDSAKAVSKITAKDLEKGIRGKSRNGNFHAYGVKGCYSINNANGIEIQKQTIVEVKKWLTENSI